MARTNTRNMQKLRGEFFDEGKTQSQSDDPDVKALAHCWLCRSAIDYVADAHTTPDSHNLDHYKTVTTHPELQEDPTNFRHSHMACNLNRGARTPSAGLGEPVADWW